MFKLCLPAWCRACLGQQCAMVVQEGQLGKLRCPESSCDQLLNRQVSLHT